MFRQAYLSICKTCVAFEQKFLQKCDVISLTCDVKICGNLGQSTFGTTLLKKKKKKKHLAKNRWQPSAVPFKAQCELGEGQGQFVGGHR